MIEIRGTRVYRGPSVWARAPVIHLSLDIGELEDRPTNAIPGFYERLTELIPSLYEHECSLGHPGGFLERLREGTLPSSCRTLPASRSPVARPAARINPASTT